MSSDEPNEHNCDVKDPESTIESTIHKHEGKWGLYDLDGTLVDHIDYCPFCGTALA